MIKIPIKPTSTANHLYRPTFSLKKKIDIIVVKIGAANVILTTVAKGRFLKAIKIATELGFEKKRWESSYMKLANVIQTVPEAFAPKNRWAMDWYYPVLSGVVTGEMGKRHLAKKIATFELQGKGIRCVSDRPWITTAETCECAMASPPSSSP